MGSGGNLPSKFGLFSLISPFSYLAAIIGFWVYIVPLAAQTGQTTGTANFGISLAIAMQILGGLGAAAFGARLNAFSVIIVSSFVAVVAVLILGHTASPVLFITAIAIFGFIWIFTPPFHLPYLIAADPTRRTAMFATTNQLFGCGAGPLLSSLLVTDHDVDGAVVASSALFAVSFVVTLWVYAATKNMRAQSRAIPSTI